VRSGPAGAWLVGTSWVADSARAGRLLEPHRYELEDCPTGAISVGARRSRGRRGTRKGPGLLTRPPGRKRATIDRPLARGAFPAHARRAGAPRHWRLRVAAAGAGGAFAGLRVLLHGAFKAPDADTLSRAVIAGGGEVLRRAPPFAAKDLAPPEEGGAHVAVVAPGKAEGEK
jgi:hypothetical protein